MDRDGESALDEEVRREIYEKKNNGNMNYEYCITMLENDRHLYINIVVC